MLRASNHCASLVIVSMIALAPGATAVAQDDYVLSAPRHWWRNWAVPPWISLAGDADGDGRVDLIAVEPIEPSHRSWTGVRRFAHTPEGRFSESGREWVNGAQPEPMSDFNDVAFIQRVGLCHSIDSIRPQMEAATPNLPGLASPGRAK